MVVVRDRRAQVDSGVMDRLGGAVGSKVSVEFSSFGETRRITGTLIGVVPFRSIKIAPDDSKDLSSFPFVGLNGAVRTVHANDALVYDNSANVPGNLVVRGFDKYNELKKATFGEGAADFVPSDAKAQELSHALRRNMLRHKELLKFFKG